MKVPRKLFISGDIEVGKTLIGRGDQQLRILESQMKHQGLKQSWRTVEFHDGTVFEVWSCFNLQQVNIYVPGGDNPKEVEESSCFANTGMAIARIIRVVDLVSVNQDDDNAVEDTVADIFIAEGTYPDNYYCTKGIRYDVQVCNSTSYLLYTNMKSTDYCLHKPGEIVLVIMTRVADIPDPILESNVNSPCTAPAFTNRVIGFGAETVAIIPIGTWLPLYETY